MSLANHKSLQACIGNILSLNCGYNLLGLVMCNMIVLPTVTQYISW